MSIYVNNRIYRKYILKKRERYVVILITKGKHRYKDSERAGVGGGVH